MKKTFTLLLSIVMLFTVGVTGGSAASFTDTEGQSCETAVDVLSALGIVEGKEAGVYAPEDSLTRAEMATIVLRLMNMADAGSGQDVFTDVPAGHWAYANISAAYQLGIVNGTSETTFNPDDAVTYEQAVKMVVAALGYTVQAEALGGYPSGYLSKAAQLDLLRGVKTGGEMTRGNMAILVYNALDVELFTKTTYGDETYEYAADETKTLLSYHLKVTKITDTITATPMGQFSAALHGRRLLSDEVAVGSTILKKGETNAQDLLGVRSDIYFREEDDVLVILAVVPRASVGIIDVRAQDIADGTNTERFIYLDAEGDEHEVDIAGAALIYNGRQERMDAALLQPAIGTARLISEGGSVDLVIIEAYESRIVNNVILDDFTVIFKDGTREVINPGDSSLPTVFTDAAGLPLTAGDLAEWDVISIATSLPHNASKVRRIYRSQEMVSGIVSEISGDEVTIGGAVYPIAPSMPASDLKLGQGAAYYLDFTGAVAAVNENYENGKTYGWLAGAALTRGLNGKPQLKIFTQEGEMKVFDLQEKVQYNGVSTSSTSLIGDSVAAPADLWAEGTEPTLWANGAVVPQLIVYETNDAGLITEIDTAANRSDPNMKDADKIGGDFSMDWYYNDANGETAGDAVEFNGTKGGNPDPAKTINSKVENISGIFFGRVWTNSSTKLFIIPSDPTRDKDYKIQPLKEFGLEETRASDYVSFYDVNEDYYCGAMVMHTYLGSTGVEFSDTYPSQEVTVALVTGMSITLGDEGEVQNTLKLYSSAGQEVTAVVPEDFRALYRTANADINSDKEWYTMTGDEKTRPQLTQTLTDRPKNMYLDVKDLDLGDVIQYQIDSSGKLTMASVCFRANHSCLMEAFAAGSNFNKNMTSVVNYPSGGKALINGKVIKTTDFGPIIEVYPSDREGKGMVDTSKTYVRALPASGVFVVWDMDKNTMRTITAADVVQDDELFAYWRNTAQWLVVVYR